MPAPSNDLPAPPGRPDGVAGVPSERATRALLPRRDSEPHKRGLDEKRPAASATAAEEMGDDLRKLRRVASPTAIDQDNPYKRAGPAQALDQDNPY
jgi:hypothetical protein